MTHSGANRTRSRPKAPANTTRPVSPPTQTRPRRICRVRHRHRTPRTTSKIRLRASRLSESLMTVSRCEPPNKRTARARKHATYPSMNLLTRHGPRRSHARAGHPVRERRLGNEQREGAQQEPTPKRLASLLVLSLEGGGLVHVEAPSFGARRRHHLGRELFRIESCEVRLLQIHVHGDDE